MCGRYSFSDDIADERVQKIISMMERDYPGEYKTGEIFPGDSAPAVIGQDGWLRHVPAIFGFPGFKDGKLLINARAETASQKPTFSEALKEHRVILPADGFYEWSHDGKKTKYLFTLDEMRTIYLCGIYKVLEGKYRFVILTRPANDSMIEIHDRMPVIAHADQVRPYLTDQNAAMEIIANSNLMLNRKPA